ncbi:branched-chain amino acid ABC transporter permease [Chelativorans sp. AA-79]|uniref:branched-chain amino acid ABC transporter permease n=1 Tax=Chelativorans sp. AA-79 TaxID=3028735 RepID=UPI0023FA0EFC|nr:branched-chain amino acid ABC transporter permease [Chelativorans sp. AA-79]WEX10402.1 branched-chain amino acid ABC transporter permease [Chelativorans sp. AA-79]
MTAADETSAVLSPDAPEHLAQAQLRRRGAWRAYEIALWLTAVALIFVLPSKALLLTEVAILALFAVSLDLILGYAGIVSLGHGAFFGLGAYVAGLFARHYFAEPVTGLLVAGVASGLLGFVTSFLVLRGSDLTRLMTTLGIALMLAELANQMAWLTGGADGLTGFTVGPILGLFPFDLWGRTGYIYSLAVLFLATWAARRLANAPFGLSLQAIKANRVRAAMVGVPARSRIVAVYTIAAVYAGFAGALLTQTTSFVSPDVLAFHRSADVLLVLVLGGVGYLYGGIIGAIVFTLLRDWLSVITPQYWMFWIGLVLVVIVMVGRENLARWQTFLPLPTQETLKRVAGLRAGAKRGDGR